MKRIFPFNSKTGTWHNYSQYLVWLDSDINSVKDYLLYYNPDFCLINNSLYYYNVNKQQTEADEAVDKYPYYEYTITDEDGEKEIANCYFPAELVFRQGFFNSTANSYLCYFNTPLADQIDDNIKKVAISKEKWESLKTQGSIVQFPSGFLIFSKTWAHQGIQNTGNSYLWDKSKYLLIGQAPASTYTITGTSNGLKCSILKTGTNTGLHHTFYFETKPTRYFIFRPGDACWGQDASRWTLEAASYKTIADTKPSLIKIQNGSGRMWTSAFPIMHHLQLEESEGSSITCEKFVMEETFSTQIVNVVNHQVAKYTINTDLLDDDNLKTSLLNKVYVRIC